MKKDKVRHKLLKERKRRGLTQKDVAEYIGVARTTYCEIENGNLNPRTATAIKISEFFGIRVNDINN